MDKRDDTFMKLIMAPQVIYEAVLGGEEEVLVGSVAGGGRWELKSS